MGSETSTTGVLRPASPPTAELGSRSHSCHVVTSEPLPSRTLIPSLPRIAAIHQRPSPLALACRHYRLSHDHASSTPFTFSASFAAPFALSPFRLLCPSRPNLASPLPSRPQSLSPRPADLSLSAFQPPTAGAIHELLKAHLPGYRHALPYLSSLRRLFFGLP